MKFQKILCLISVIVGGLVFLYSLGIITDLYDSLYFTMRNADPSKVVVPGSYVYYEIQDFNKLFVRLAIVLILIAALLFITSTHVRRRYYIANYISVGLYTIYSIAFTVWAHIQIEFYKAKFLQIDFVKLKEYSEEWKTYYTESTFWFDIHYLVLGLLLLTAILHIVNFCFKLQLMKEEQRIIEEGKEAAVV